MPALRSIDHAALADMVGLIYEAAIDPARWIEFVELVENIYPDARITMFAHRNGRPTSGLAAQKNFRGDDLQAYSDYYVKNSPYVAGVGKLTLGVVNYSEHIISDQELFKTEHYNDFVKPRRLGHYATGILLERDAQGMTAFSIADHKNDEARRSHQKRLLLLLSVHLQRAIKLHRTLACQNAVAAATKAAFDRWTQPAFVLNADARVVSMNTAAAELLKREDCIWLDRDGQLRSLDDARSRAIELVARKCADIADRPASAGDTAIRESLLLPRPAPAPPLQAAAWTLPFLDQRAEFAAPQGRVLLIVFDPLHVPRTPVKWLSRQFGLSPAEERLTETIVNGVTLADAAEQIGIQISTARTRLKAIQTKTGCNRQVDLVRLAMSTPIVRQD
jgi:DNA-binding CsgD family transcriptional regulator